MTIYFVISFTNFVTCIPSRISWYFVINFGSFCACYNSTSGSFQRLHGTGFPVLRWCILSETTKHRSYLRSHIALPSEHGSWVFLFSPLLIGIFTAGRFTPVSAILVIGLLAAFLLRQPVVIAVKAYSGRRSRSDLPAARFWILIYGVIALAALAGLVVNGYISLLFLLIPGLPVFYWHLWLVSRRQERRKPGVEILGSGVLALSAPAALWVGMETYTPLGWVLLLLTWLQSAASIVYAYLRLEQRELKTTPPKAKLWRMAARALLYTSVNLLLVVGLAVGGIVPRLLFIPYIIQWLETIYGSIKPALGLKPTQIGIRQLAVSTLFSLCFIVVWVTS